MASALFRALVAFSFLVVGRVAESDELRKVPRGYMDAASWIALGSAVVALVAAAITFWQAVTAKDAASFARRQAEAAERQVVEMKRQFEADTAARDEAAGPAFEAKKAEIFYDGERFIEATLVMTSGPPLALVSVRLASKDARGLVRRAGDHEWMESQEFRDVSSGARIDIAAQMEWETSAPVNLRVDLECQEDGGRQRTWRRSCTALAQERPESRSRRQPWS